MSKAPTGEDVTERTIVLQVLREDHPHRWTRKELRREIYDIKASAIDQALARLEAEGVVILEGKEVRASLCALRLDAIGMVSI